MLPQLIRRSSSLLAEFLHAQGKDRNVSVRRQPLCGSGTHGSRAREARVLEAGLRRMQRHISKVDKRLEKNSKRKIASQSPPTDMLRGFSDCDSSQPGVYTAEK